MLRPLLLLIGWLVAVGTQFVSAAEPSVGRYLAVFADATRVDGETIHGWYSADDPPRLDSTALSDANRPLSWLCDRTLPALGPTALGPTALEPTALETTGHAQGFVEMVDGDRLPGRVIGFVPEGPAPEGSASEGPAPEDSAAEGTASEGPASEGTGVSAGGPHLLVVPSVSVNFPGLAALPHVRVLTRLIRRVVFFGKPRPRLEPGTLFYRDGRRMPFRNLRWATGSVTVLSSEGTRRVAMAELAEIHLPRRDGWVAYYEMLAVLSPDCSVRLLRLETTDGLLATASDERFEAAMHKLSEEEQFRYQMVQPAWSLDPLWVRFETIRLWWSFPPHEVPLSRLYPIRSVQQQSLGRSWHWRTDRNVRGGTLYAGSRQYGWGFGVHAANELWFELPDCVQAFRGHVGLDHIAGSGGCARAMLYVNRREGSPVYQSPHLIGAKQVVDVPTYPLAGPTAGQHLLGLLTDEAHQGRPAGADPLDIRDMLDWLEPVLLLDQAKLKQNVEAASTRLFPAKPAAAEVPLPEG